MSDSKKPDSAKGDGDIVAGDETRQRRDSDTPGFSNPPVSAADHDESTADSDARTEESTLGKRAKSGRVTASNVVDFEVEDEFRQPIEMYPRRRGLIDDEDNSSNENKPVDEFSERHQAALDDPESIYRKPMEDVDDPDDIGKVTPVYGDDYAFEYPPRIRKTGDPLYADQYAERDSTGADSDTAADKGLPSNSNNDANSDATSPTSNAGDLRASRDDDGMPNRRRRFRPPVGRRFGRSATLFGAKMSHKPPISLVSNRTSKIQASVLSVERDRLTSDEIQQEVERTRADIVALKLQNKHFGLDKRLADAGIPRNRGQVAAVEESEARATPKSTSRPRSWKSPPAGNEGRASGVRSTSAGDARGDIRIDIGKGGVRLAETGRLEGDDPGQPRKISFENDGLAYESMDQHDARAYDATDVDTYPEFEDIDAYGLGTPLANPSVRSVADDEDVAAMGVPETGAVADYQHYVEDIGVDDANDLENENEYGEAFDDERPATTRTGKSVFEIDAPPDGESLRVEPTTPASFKTMRNLVSDRVHRYARKRRSDEQELERQVSGYRMWRSVRWIALGVTVAVVLHIVGIYLALDDSKTSSGDGDNAEIAVGIKQPVEHESRITAIEPIVSEAEKTGDDITGDSASIAQQSAGDDTGTSLQSGPTETADDSETVAASDPSGASEDVARDVASVELESENVSTDADGIVASGANVDATDAASQAPAANPVAPIEPVATDDGVTSAITPPTDRNEAAITVDEATGVAEATDVTADVTNDTDLAMLDGSDRLDDDATLTVAQSTPVTETGTGAPGSLFNPIDAEESADGEEVVVLDAGPQVTQANDQDAREVESAIAESSPVPLRNDAVEVAAADVNDDDRAGIDAAAPEDDGTQPIDIAVAAPTDVLDDRAAAEADRRTEIEIRNSTEAKLDVARDQIASLRLTTPVGDNAFETLTNILELDPDNLEATAALGDIRERYMGWAARDVSEGNFDEAIQNYRKVMQIDPDNAESIDLIIADVVQRRDTLDDDTINRESSELDAIERTAVVNERAAPDYNPATEEEAVRPLPEVAPEVVARMTRARATLNELGIDVTIRNLIDLTNEGDYDGVNLLLQAGLSVDSRAGQYGFSPLIVTAIRGDTGMLKLLLDNDVDINGRSSDGRTALMAAAWNGHKYIVDTLLQNNASVHVANADGWTALHYAAWQGHSDIVKTLLSEGADPSVRNGDGWTVAETAERKGFIQILEIIEAQSRG